MKILLVDDDPQMTALVSHRLKEDNYVVDAAFNGEYAIELLSANPYGLVLLDVALPNLSGIELCKKIRQLGDQTPVLMMTGRHRIQDRVMGLDAGADDYLVKPFELDELVARVRALLRRNSAVADAVIEYGRLRFDTVSQVLTYGDRTVSLRPKELAILELMLRYPTRVFDQQAILDQLWNLADCPSVDTVKSHIRSLRKRLEAVGASAVIETLYGRGYRLDPGFLALEAVVERPEINNEEIVAQTWAQVQSISWHRLKRLQDCIQRLKAERSQLFEERSGYGPEMVEEARAIAHQMKGTLGTFGFGAAASRARVIEDLLNDSKTLDIDDIQGQVDVLQPLLEKQMADDAEAEVAVGYALVISRDRSWADRLQQLSQTRAFAVQVCSPLSMNTYLLQQRPQLIVLDVSVEEASVDVPLLKVLLSNYGGQVPIVGIQPQGALPEMPSGVSAWLHKGWSLKTLLAVMSEYL